MHIASDRNLIDARFPVQYVLRPYSAEHPTTGATPAPSPVARSSPATRCWCCPSGFTSTVASIDTADGPVDEAFAPMSVTITLADEIDISRGDMICRPHNQPRVTQDVDAMVCWMDETSSLQARSKLAIKHTTRSARALVKDLHYRLDVNTLHRDEEASELGLNEIGRVTLRTTLPLFCDEYRRNRSTGSFILIDESTNATVGAGMILGDGRRDRGTNVTWHGGEVDARRPAPPGRDGVADRPVGVREVDGGGRPRGAAGRRGPTGVPARR